MYPSHGAAYLRMADASLKEGNHRLAWILFSSAIALAPHSVDGYVGRSAVTCANGNYLTALLDTAKALVWRGLGCYGL
jgi:hypothetical protein